MALDYTGTGAARFDEPATMGWAEPYPIESETAYRLKLKLRKVTGDDPQIVAGFLCYDDRMIKTGELLEIVETVTLDTNWSYYQADFTDWPAGTTQVIQVFQLLNENSTCEVDEYLCEDIQAINEAKKVQAWIIDGFYTKVDADEAIAQQITELRTLIEDPNGNSVAASLAQNHYTKSAADQAIATANMALKAQIEDPLGTSVGAALAQDYYTIAGTDSAISAEITTLGSRLDGDIGALSSNLSQNYYTKTAADAATSQAITTLESDLEGQIGSVSANLTNNYYTKTGTDGAITTASNALRSQIEDPNGTSLGATLATLYYTKTGTDDAISTEITALETRIDGDIAATNANLTNNYYTKSAADQVIAAADTTLKTNLEGQINTVSSNLNNNYYTKAAADSAIAAANTTLETHVEDQINSVSANLTNNYYTKSSADAAITSQVNAMKTTIESPTGTSVGGKLEDFKALKASAIDGTAFGSFRTQVLSDVSGLQSSVTAQGTSISTLQGNASAGYLIKAQTGGSVSLLNLVAADGSAGAVSIAKIAATNILLDGSVSMRHLTVTDTGRAMSTSFESDEDLLDWEILAGSGELSVVTDTGSVHGGKALRAGNRAGNDEVWMVHKKRLPFDPNASYKITVRAWQNSTDGGGFYMGLMGYDRYGNKVNRSGDDSSSSQHYVVSSNRNLGGWTVLTGYVKGHAAAGTGGESPSLSSPGAMHSNVNYIAPMMILNYPNNTGMMIVDYVSIEKMSDTTTIAPNSVTTDQVNTNSFSASGLAVFNGTLKSSDFVAGSKGWRIQNSGAAEFLNLISRADLKDNSVSDVYQQAQTSNLGPHQSATNTWLSNYTLSNWERGSILTMGWQAEIRVPSAGDTITVELQVRRSSLGGGYGPWVTLATEQVTSTSWAVYSAATVLAGLYDNVQFRTGYRTTFGGSTTVIRQVYLTLQKVTK